MVAEFLTDLSILSMLTNVLKCHFNSEESYSALSIVKNYFLSLYIFLFSVIEDMELNVLIQPGFVFDTQRKVLFLLKFLPLAIHNHFKDTAYYRLIKKYILKLKVKKIDSSFFLGFFFPSLS